MTRFAFISALSAVLAALAIGAPPSVAARTVAVDSACDGSSVRLAKATLRTAREDAAIAGLRAREAEATARKAAAAAREARLTAERLSMTVLPERRESDENVRAAETRLARADATRAEFAARKLGAQAAQLQLQSTLTRFEAADAERQSARALQAARDANRWRRMVASTNFTPEQIAVLAQIAAGETGAAAEKSPTTGLTAAQSSELAAMAQAEREALALKSPPAVALIDCGV